MKDKRTGSSTSWLPRKRHQLAAWFGHIAPKWLTSSDESSHLPLNGQLSTSPFVRPKFSGLKARELNLPHSIPVDCTFSLDEELVLRPTPTHTSPRPTGIDAGEDSREAIVPHNVGDEPTSTTSGEQMSTPIVRIPRDLLRETSSHIDSLAHDSVSAQGSLVQLQNITTEVSDQAGNPETDTFSQKIYEQMLDTYHLDLPQTQFFGLCAYLCALLQLGFSLAESEMDLFLVQYNDFTACLPTLEESQVQEGSSVLRSYHQWFREKQGNSSVAAAMILTEATLRRIWKDVPYTFLRAKLNLEYAARAHKARQRYSSVLNTQEM